MILDKRAAGILFPVFSLPSSGGIGTFGKDAYRFADCLKKAGQTYWQILPIGPTGYGDSPYQSFSAYAGNLYFIDPELLREEGLLKEDEAGKFPWGNNERKIDYGLLYQNRGKLLQLAFQRFRPDADYEEFLTKSADWLPGYADFMRRKEGNTKEFYAFVQYEFYRQWFRLKKYVNSLGIRIIGDIPIYVAMDSADVEADRKLFRFCADGTPEEVAGCPPDAFSASGQFWGNPLYNWTYMRKKPVFSWWIGECSTVLNFICGRVDHLPGFDEYYAIPYGAPDATGGRWEKGPGMKLFRALKEALGELPIIAEDLGYLTDSVRKLVNDTGYPGMKVLEFAFDSREQSNYLPDTWTPNSAAYTGTHDNQTLKSWFLELQPEDRQNAADYMHRSVEEILKGDYVLDFIRMTMNSVANTAVIPMQDYLELDADARINKPASIGRNWCFRFTEALFSDKVWDRVYDITKESGRERR